MSEGEIKKLLQELIVAKCSISKILLAKPPKELSKYCSMDEEISNICAEQKFIDKYKSVHIKEIQKRDNVNIEVNHSVLYEFFQNVGGDLFISDPKDTIEGLWIIEMDGTYYNEDGPLNNIDIQTTGKKISQNHNLESFVRNSDVMNKKFDLLRDIYFTYAGEAQKSIMNQLQSILNYTDLSVPFPDHKGRIYMIRHEGEMRILRIFDPGELSSSVEELVHVHRLFSDENICPHVYASGILYPEQGGQAYVYVVMKYIPMTISSIPNKQKRAYAVKEAIKVGYRIQELGYYGIDNHAGNFLYDAETDQVYAIDFAQLTQKKGKNNLFTGIRDININGDKIGL